MLTTLGYLLRSSIYTDLSHNLASYVQFPNILQLFIPMETLAWFEDSGNADSLFIDRLRYVVLGSLAVVYLSLEETYLKRFCGQNPWYYLIYDCCCDP